MIVLQIDAAQFTAQAPARCRAANTAERLELSFKSFLFSSKKNCNRPFNRAERLAGARRYQRADFLVEIISCRD
jgi:hypothetical protein